MEIANICLEGKSLACAMNNFRRAKEMFAETGDITQSMIAYDFLAYVTHQVGYLLKVSQRSFHLHKVA